MPSKWRIHWGVEFVPVWVRPEDFPPTIAKLVRQVGEPLADPAWVPSALLASRAAQDVRVALVGEGADELFGGYPTYFGANLAGYYARLPGSVRALIRRAVESWPASDKKVTIPFLLKRFIQGDELNFLGRHILWTSCISPAILNRLGVTPPFDYKTQLFINRNAGSTSTARFGNFAGGRIINQGRSCQYEISIGASCTIS